MTQIYINQVNTMTDDINNIKSVTFDYLEKKVNAATEVRRIYGTYLSSVIVASSLFLRWDHLIWEGTLDDNSGVYFYIKSANSENELQVAEWVGPYSDLDSDISAIDGRFLQVLVVLRNDGINNGLPRIDKLQLYFKTSENAARFYTKAFHVGFTPKHAVLTYNADQPDDSIIRFAISGDDTTDISKYQYLKPNSIVRLDSVSYLSDDVKIMVEIIGSSGDETAVHEFAVMLGGDNATRINKETLVSSSSSSSSSSSLSSNSSSSSIDSSSSTSGGYSSESSSTSEEFSTESSSSSIDSSSSESSSSLSIIDGIWPPMWPESESSSSSSS